MLSALHTLTQGFLPSSHQYFIGEETKAYPWTLHSWVTPGGTIHIECTASGTHNVVLLNFLVIIWQVFQKATILIPKPKLPTSVSFRGNFCRTTE